MVPSYNKKKTSRDDWSSIYVFPLIPYFNTELKDKKDITID